MENRFHVLDITRSSIELYLVTFIRQNR